MVGHLTEFDGKQLQSVAKGGLDLGKLEDEAEKKEAEKAADEYKELLEKGKEAFSKAQKEGTVGDVPTAYARQAMMGLGRLNEQSGDYKAAKEIYEAIVKLPSFDDEQKELDKQLTAEKPETKSSSAKDEAREQSKQVRENLKAATRQFAFKKVAEERLKQLKARGV